MKKRLLISLMMLLPILGFAHDEWITYSDGTYYAGVGTTHTLYDIAIKYTPDDIKDLGMTQVAAVQVHTQDNGAPPYGVSGTVLKIWSGTEEIYSESFDYSLGNWSTINLSTPVDIDPTKDLYIGVRFTAGGNPNFTYSSADNVLNHPGKGNLWRPVPDGVPEAWTTTEHIGDWNIKVAPVYGGGTTEITLGYGDGTCYSGVGTTHTLYDIAIKYDVEDIADLGITEITSVEVHISSNGSPVGLNYTDLKIWSGNEEIHSESFDYSLGDWSTINLTTPIAIDPTKDLYIGVRFTAGGNPNWTYSSADQILDNPGKGNLWRPVPGGVPEAWTTTEHMGDWNIRAKATAALVEPWYTVTFSDIKEATLNPMYMGPCDDAVVSLGTKVNSAGNYEFSVPAGEYRYIISKPGFTSVVGTLEVKENTTVDSKTLFSGVNPYYTISFDVKDEQGNAVNDTEIVFNDRLWRVDSADNIQPGIYPYTVTKFGYDVYEGSLVAIKNEAVEVVLTTQERYAVSFNVKQFDILDDNGKPLTNAVVSVGFVENEAGDYNFNMPAGTYPYVVSKAGLRKAHGYIEVDEEGLSKEVLLMPENTGTDLYGTSFWVKKADDSHLMNVATITFNGVELTAQEPFLVLEPGIYDYSIEAEGFYTYYGKHVVVEEQWLSIVMEELPKYNVLFNVALGDPVDMTLVDNAVISLGKEKNQAGNYTFPVNSGEYPYIVSLDGYKTQTGVVTVTNKNVNVPYIYLVEGDSDLIPMKFKVVNSEGDVVDDAVIELNGKTYAAGEYTINVKADIYNYTITHRNYETYTGQVVFTKSQELGINLGDCAHYTLTFDVNVEGYGIVLNNTPLLTNSVEVLPGTYNYTVTKDGYDTVTGSVVVDDRDVTETVTLVLSKYTVTFEVKDDKGNVLNDYGIVFDNETLSTNTVEVLPGTYNYTLTKDGYDTVTGTVVVSDRDVTETVRLVLTKYTLTFDVRDEKSNALDGYEIVFANETLSGNSVVVAPGTYAYTVSKDKYHSVEGTVTVDKQDVTVNVILKYNDVALEGVNATEIAVYPNPFTSYIIVDAALDSFSKVTIFDIAGKPVYRASFVNQRIDLDTLTKGRYILILSNEEGNLLQYKLIKN